MHIWSRKLCRWVLWHGSRKAWLALPAAVVTSACVGTIALATRPTERLAVVPHARAVAVPEPGSLAVLATGVVLLITLK